MTSHRDRLDGGFLDAPAPETTCIDCSRPIDPAWFRCAPCHKQRLDLDGPTADPGGWLFCACGALRNLVIVRRVTRCADCRRMAS